MKRFFGFGVVGTVGFAADAAALAVLVRILALDPFLARILSIGLALTVTWLLNRTYTFGPSTRHAAVEGARYGSIGIGTSIFNYAVYSAVLLIAPWVPPLAALVAASGLTMVLSFTGYSRFVFDR